MSLTEFEIKNIKSDKRTMKRDDRGLYLIVHPNGSKFWKYRYKKNGKERKISLGEYPHIKLREARQKRDEIERKISMGQPLEPDNAPQENTFAETAEEWLKTRVLPDKAQTYIESIEQRLKKYILPVIGNKQLKEITPSVILNMCRSIEEKGILETAQRCKQVVGQVFKYAIATGKAETEPTNALTGALKTRKTKHFATITNPARIALLYKQIREYPFLVVRCALMYSLLTFARPGEIRKAEWHEIDFENKEWHIPFEKMKIKMEQITLTRKVHIVPISEQLMKILQQLKPITGAQKWIFPSARADGKPMSENTVRVALRTMGYTNEDIVPHGFRAMASTILNENGFTPDIIEKQLAHTERNAVRAAYNHAEYLPERRKMMQWWSDWLDSLK